MVRAVVVAHVIAARHVALNALCAAADLEQHFSVCRKNRFTFFTLLLVEMMLHCVVLSVAVALQAKFVTFFDQFHRMHLVAVAAAHIVAVHFGLGKRAVDIDFVQDLPVGEIQVFVQQAGQIVVQQVIFGMVRVAQRSATCMTGRTDLDQLPRVDV